MLNHIIGMTLFMLDKNNPSISHIRNACVFTIEGKLYLKYVLVVVAEIGFKLRRDIRI